MTSSNIMNIGTWDGSGPAAVMITNEGLGTELAWDIYSKLKLKGKIESHEFNFT